MREKNKILNNRESEEFIMDLKEAQHISCGEKKEQKLRTVVYVTEIGKKVSFTFLHFPDFTTIVPIISTYIF